MLLNCATFSGGPHAAPAQPLPEWGVAVGSRRPSLLTWPVEAILGKRPVVKKASSLSALGGLVYSTDGGRHCPDCQQPKDACICGQAVAPVGDGIARVRRETKAAAARR